MIKVLLVDDEKLVRMSLGKILEHNNFEVKTSANVPDALKLISSETFDVLLSDLHMPGAGDGLTLVSAMRHANPAAVTLLLSGFPDVDAAAHAILMQADEILVKPISVPSLIEVIRERLASPNTRPRAQVESVATVLERSAPATISEWYDLVLTHKLLVMVPMSRELRCAHLPQLFRDLVSRLREAKPIDTRSVSSLAATLHGTNRRKQGYSAVMMVEESRILQVSIFQSLQNNLASMDFSVLLIGVMTIADEVDAQLSAAMSSYKIESLEDTLPA